MADGYSRRRIAARKSTRRYREHTLILETRFETATGILLVTDFMPVRETHSDVVRIARCLEGSVKVQMELCIRFDYGRTIPWTGARERNTWAAAAGPGVAYLRTQEQIETKGDIASAEFTLNQGQHRSFVLTHVGAQEPPPRRINVQKALNQTERFWRQWCSSNTLRGTVAGCRGAIADYAQSSHLSAYRRDRRCSHDIVARIFRQGPKLGLSLLLAARRCFHPRILTLGWVSRGGSILAKLASSGCWERCAMPADHVWDAGRTASAGMRASMVAGISRVAAGPDGKCASEQMQLDVYGEVADAIVSMKRAGLHLDERLLHLQTRTHGLRRISLPSSRIRAVGAARSEEALYLLEGDGLASPPSWGRKHEGEKGSENGRRYATVCIVRYAGEDSTASWAALCSLSTPRSSTLLYCCYRSLGFFHSTMIAYAERWRSSRRNSAKMDSFIVCHQIPARIVNRPLSLVRFGWFRILQEQGA